MPAPEYFNPNARQVYEISQTWRKDPGAADDPEARDIAARVLANPNDARAVEQLLDMEWDAIAHRAERNDRSVREQAVHEGYDLCESTAGAACEDCPEQGTCDEVQPLADEPTEDEDRPTRCPFCGNEILIYDMADWSAYSLEDTTNRAVLRESQCALCNRSFWS